MRDELCRDMCRMIAVAGACKSLYTLLIQFQKLSIHGNSLDGNGHRDGWGIGYYLPCPPSHAQVNHGTMESPFLVKRAECAFTSTEYEKTAQKASPAHTVLAHLRKASPGTPVTVQEVHPFQHHGMLFCHNGTIFSTPSHPLESDLDSIILFRRILSHSLRKAIRFFWDHQYTSLTCILTDGHTIWAYRDFSQDEQYYTLYYLTTAKSVVVCSEPLFPGSWKLLQNHELLTISPDLHIESALLSSKGPASSIP